MADGPVEPDLWEAISILTSLMKQMNKRLGAIERALSEEPQSTFQPRKSPDERVAQATDQMWINLWLLHDAVKEGGSFRRPGVISGMRYALSEIPEHVLTPMEQEAAND